MDIRFKKHSCPITNVRAPNHVLSLGGYHISYNPSVVDYGSDTTALVLKETVFFILNGDHADAFARAADENGIQGCIDLFISRLHQASKFSEHGEAVGVQADPFNLKKHALEAIGQENVDRIAQAMKNASGQVLN